MRSLTKQSAALAAAIGVPAMAADAPAATATAHSPPPCHGSRSAHRGTATSTQSTAACRTGPAGPELTTPSRRMRCRSRDP